MREDLAPGDVVDVARVGVGTIVGPYGYAPFGPAWLVRFGAPPRADADGTVLAVNECDIRAVT